MARKYWRRQLVVADVETAYGAGSALTGAKAFPAENVELTPLQSNAEQSNYLLPYFGATPTQRTVKRQQLAFDLPIAGAKTAGALPGYTPLLRGCGFAAVQTVGTDVQFDPATASPDSTVLGMYYDGRKHLLLGSRGNAELRFEAQRRPMIRYTFTSLWQAPVTEAMPAPDITRFAKAAIVNKANTIVTIGGWTAPTTRVTVPLGNTVTPHFVTAVEEVLITGRAVTFEIVVDASDLVDFDPFTLGSNSGTVPVSVVHGTVAGNIVQLDLAALEIGEPTLGNTDGIEQWTIRGTALPTDGDDELKLTVK